jgi:predicted ester cyclase
MNDLVERLLRLWTQPADEAGLADRFAELYTDPVIVNGTALSLEQMSERARTLQAALAGLSAEVLQVIESDDAVAVAFVMRGRHTGPYPGPTGPIEATGAEVAVRTIDVLTLTDGKISRIWVNADDLGLLRHLGALPT